MGRQQRLGLTDTGNRKIPAGRGGATVIALKNNPNVIGGIPVGNQIKAGIIVFKSVKLGYIIDGFIREVGDVKNRARR